MLYPLKFTPILKERIWGGRKLNVKFGRVLPSDRVGESWDVACHQNGTSIVANGEFKNKSLRELMDIFGRELVGTALKENAVKKFPLLIKILDAADVLSVQVHPDDSYAAQHEYGELGKSEMWYIIEAEPGARLFYGVRPGVTRKEFRLAIEEGRLEGLLNELKVKAGDVVYIPAGMIHAIGEGIMICEIQQNSDTTYRVYDWNRVGDDGKPRELHVNKALDVIDFEGKYSRDKVAGVTVEEDGGLRTFYVACRYFAMEKLQVNGQMKGQANGEKFFTLTVVEGRGQINYAGGVQPFSAGDSFMIPASMGSYSIEGQSVIIKAYVPDKEKDIITPLKNRNFTVEQMHQIAGLFEG